MIIQFIILIIFAASILYILFHTPLFRKIRMVYLVVGTFIASIILVPILYQFIIITFFVDICLLAYIRHIHQSRKVDNISEYDNISKAFVRIEHAARNLSLPFYYYLIIAFFLLLFVIYISSDFFLNLYYTEQSIFSDTGIVLPNSTNKIDSYQLVILWILIVSAGVFFLKKIIRSK